MQIEKAVCVVTGKLKTTSQPKRRTSMANPSYFLCCQENNRRLRSQFGQNPGELIMKLHRTITTIGLFWLALAMPTPAPCAEPAAPKKTPLDDYIAKADPTYSWK